MTDTTEQTVSVAITYTNNFVGLCENEDGQLVALPQVWSTEAEAEAAAEQAKPTPEAKTRVARFRVFELMDEEAA